MDTFRDPGYAKVMWVVSGGSVAQWLSGCFLIRFRFIVVRLGLSLRQRVVWAICMFLWGLDIITKWKWESIKKTKKLWMFPASVLSTWYFFMGQATKWLRGNDDDDDDDDDFICFLCFVFRRSKVSSIYFMASLSHSFPVAGPAILTSLKARQPQCRYLCACGFCFVAVLKHFEKGSNKISCPPLKSVVRKKKWVFDGNKWKCWLVTHNFKIMAKSCEWVRANATAEVTKCVQAALSINTLNDQVWIYVFNWYHALFETSFIGKQLVNSISFTVLN